MKARILLCLVTILSGSCGHGPDAHRIRPDTNDAYYPQRDIHFVEHGRRSKGVLVAATKGFDSAFQASWATVLVPLAPGKLEGPAWTGRAVGGDRARAIAALPQHRNAIDLARQGDLGRFRFREPAAWVLGTDPYILGLPAGKPQLNWRAFALKTTGVTRPQVDTPLDMWLARFVVDEELSQPLARLVVYPDGFWKAEEAGRTEGLEVTVVTLPAPRRSTERSTPSLPATRCGWGRRRASRSTKSSLRTRSRVGRGARTSSACWPMRLRTTRRGWAGSGFSFRRGRAS